MIRKQVGTVPIVFLGNKMDLGERLVVSEEELRSHGTIHNAAHFLSSAKSGHGVNEAFRALADAIGHRARRERADFAASSTPVIREDNR